MKLYFHCGKTDVQQIILQNENISCVSMRFFSFVFNMGEIFRNMEVLKLGGGRPLRAKEDTHKNSYFFSV